jgi:hypothetical protein
MIRRGHYLECNINISDALDDGHISQRKVILVLHVLATVNAG